eukprot:jgi/Picsp_1/3932/NSC_01444-R1_protein kinase
MFAKLSALVGSSSSLPFETVEEYGHGWGHWTHSAGKMYADGSRVSVFRISAESETDPKLIAARNGVKRLKMLRHPDVLKFRETVEAEEKGKFVIYLVTEPVQSLDHTIKSLVFEGNDYEKFSMMGLQQIVSALSFLVNDCSLIHGNVCSRSVMVTETLDWKLQAFDLTTEHALVAQISAGPPLLASSWLVAPQYMSGELGRSEWDVIAAGPVWSVDAWGLGCLIQEVFSKLPLTKMEELKRLDFIPQKIKPYYQKLLSSQPAKRLNPSALIESGVLKNDLLAIVTFLQNLAMKDSIEKDSFFKRLDSQMNDIPQFIAQKKLLPLLASSLEYGGAPPSALCTLLNLARDLDQEAKDKQVIPVIIRLFSSTDRAIRRSLLENINLFGSELTDQLVEEQIYPKLQPGFTDANPYIRELTLKSMVILGPKLNSRTLNQSLLKYLAKLQVDEEPGIRANTTVLLGMLAPSLGESTRKKVLLNAFARALKDPFPPARVAGLKALQKTSDDHGIDDIATRIIPMISPACVDGTQEVRNEAMSCLGRFVDKLKHHQITLDQHDKETVSERKDSQSSSGVMSSFGFGTASAATPPLDARQTVAPSSTSSPFKIAHARDSSGVTESYSTPQILNDNGDSAQGSQEQSAWEEDNDLLEDMMDAAEAEREARARLNNLSVGNQKQATTRKSSQNPSQHTKRPSGSAQGKRSGLKLGAKKLSSAVTNDDDFSEW